jgi:hypothetical protein
MSQDFSGFPGTQRYAPVRLLGIGGMGAVYEVEDRTTGGRLALKVMLVHDAGRLLRFKQEFRVMAELHHPNLVRLFDLGQHEGQWFFTMELVHGQDLLDVLLHEDAGRHIPSLGATLPGGPLLGDVEQASQDTVIEAPEKRPIACDPDVLIGVVAQILDALAYLHGRGIVHRDLKPSNILLDLDGTVRVLDFGLASRLDRTTAISQEGAIVGTLAYLSPEQYRGEAATAASDLYALGCMMFQLLTGELPFQGSPAQALAGRMDRPPPRVDARVSGAPQALVEIVHRLMARDPAERPTIAEVRDALGRAPAQRSAIPVLGKGGRADITAEIFVGRQEELTILADALARAAGGEPQIALVSGPSGIGKSALASMILRRAASLGFLCFNGRCYEREQVPFVAFDRVMDAVTLTLRHWSPAHLASLRPWLLVLARIFPALGLLTGDAGAEATGRAGADPRELHQQAFDSFRHLIAYCQGQAPLFFVLDDLQWADEESIALLSAMLSGSAGRVMVVGLFRAEDLREDHPLHRLLRGLDGQGRVTRLALSALGSSEAAHLVEAVTGSRLDPEMSAALASQAEGNPFLVRRLAEHLLTLAPAEQTARLDDTGSADDLLRTMIQALSPRAEQVLSLAATAGKEIAVSLLREASGLGSEELDLAIGELMAARFLKAVPVGPDAEASPHLDLYHDRIREVAYQRLPEERRRALHLCLALALEARPSGRERDAEALVRHFRGAGDRVLVRRYAVEAAEQAAAKLAFLRAARLFRVVLDDPEPGEDPLVTAARWERVGDLFEYGGHHLEAARAYQQAQRRWDEAPEDHPERPVARLRLRGLAGANLLATEHIREGRAVFESGLSLMGLPLDRPASERMAVLAALKVRTMVAERFASSAPREKSRLLSAEVRLLDLMVRAYQPLWPEPAAEAALRGELLGRRIDDKRVLQRSIASGAAVPVLLGPCSPAELEQAHARLDAADELARSHDLPLGRELVQLNRSLLWLATNTTRARRSCETALEGFTRRGMLASFDGDVARIYYLYILVAKGDDDDALAAIERELSAVTPNFVNVGIAHAEKVCLLSRRGLREEARAAHARHKAHFSGTPITRIGFACQWAGASVLVAEGRFAEVLAGWEERERVARASGAWALGFDRSMWLEIELEAALGVLRQKGLSARQHIRARMAAAWLARRGVFDFRCMGYRALALLEHAEGRPGAATRALRRALSLSSVNTRPRLRWLCLEAARDLRAITLDQEAEAAELAAEGRFALPSGWRG